MTFKTSSKKAAEIAAASKNEEHLMNNITHPGLHDCLCGRGGHATNHPGNVHFRMLVSQYKDYYMGLSRYGKLQVAAEVVKLWRSQSPAGRFLAMTDPSKRENTTWHDIGDKEAIKKTSQCLRERIPPNQKARTLAMVSKKAKALQDQQSLATKQKINSAIQLHEDSSCSVNESVACAANASLSPPSSISADSRNSSSNNLFNDWEQSRNQQLQLLDDDCEPRPIHMDSGSSNNNGLFSSNNNSCTMALQQQLLQLQPTPLMAASSNTNTTTMNSAAAAHHGHHGRDAQSFNSLGSFNTDMWLDLLDDSEDTSNNNDSSSNQQGAGESNVDVNSIPSAANLTRDAFDDEIYRPNAVFKQQDATTNNFMNSTGTANTVGTTLNETLTSGFMGNFDAFFGM